MDGLELQIQAAEKEEDSKRSEQEEWRLSSQADELDKRLAKLRRQEARLNRKIYSLGEEKTHILTEESETEMVFGRLLLI